MYDCLHDMGDPRGCASHVRKILKKDGTWMIVEPIAGDKPEQNMNPVGRLYYNASTMICVPTSLDQEVGEGLGAQAGQAKLTEVIGRGGFSRVRRATEGPFNMVLEARTYGPQKEPPVRRSWWNCRSCFEMRRPTTEKSGSGISESLASVALNVPGRAARASRR
jgi:hypothetical protein